MLFLRSNKRSICINGHGVAGWGGGKEGGRGTNFTATREAESKERQNGR